MTESGVTRVSWGPQHPITGQLRIIIEVDGDRLVSVTPDIGFTHRGIEKMAEYRTYMQFVPVMERTCIFDPTNHVFPYAEAVEAVLGVEVPERAKYLRVIAAEISRIMSHLYAVTLMTLSTGQLTPMMWCTGDRELILDLAEMLTGARVGHSYIAPGGVRRDMPEGFKKRAEENLNFFEKRLEDYKTLILDNRIFQARTKGVGYVSREEAKKLSLAGPNLRASGIPMDLRKDEPYAAYENIDFDAVEEDEGDCYARNLVRFRELYESIRIIRQALNDLPSGETRTKIPVKIPPGEAFAHTETARGQLGVYLKSDGDYNPYRVKISSPSFRSLSGLSYVARNAKLADLSVIYMSFDAIPLDVDR